MVHPWLRLRFLHWSSRGLSDGRQIGESHGGLEPMKNFKISYRWQGRDYEAHFPGRCASQAIDIAQVQLMNGAANLYAVEVSA